MNDINAERKAKRFRKFEGLGQDEVRRGLDSGLYNGSEKAWAVEWLAQFDRGYRESDEEFKRESRKTARSAKTAAWIAAMAAIVAAIAAIVSVAVMLSV